MLDTADKMLLSVLETLDESQARWFVGREAVALGRGGVSHMSELTGMSRTTILRGIKELKDGIPSEAAQRVRRPGGGRERLEETSPGLDRALQKIMDETTAGDPMSLLRWTSKSTAAIADELGRQGHAVSGETVRRRLIELDYSLQGNAKNKEHASEDGRDEEFRYINSKIQNGFAERAIGWTKDLIARLESQSTAEAGSAYDST